MRESVTSAFTTAMNIIREDIRNEFILSHPHGFHIHTPGGGVPKDGPSAGCAFTTAFVSRILNKEIKNNIAMTGEIELTGKITKIGGLQYKLTGAKRAGVNLILVSEENKEDVETIKKEYYELFENDFEIILVNNIKQVLKYALVDYDDSEII
jgi:ATP-dependent Lon protease